MFKKEDFQKLEVIGQFNKGFIMAIMKEQGNMFIVDQHASDEKYNFETLSRTTKISPQDLVNPLKI